MYFPDRGCEHTILTLYVYATVSYGSHVSCVTSVACVACVALDGNPAVRLSAATRVMWLWTTRLRAVATYARIGL